MWSLDTPMGMHHHSFVFEANDVYGVNDNNDVYEPYRMEYYDESDDEGSSQVFEANR